MAGNRVEYIIDLVANDKQLRQSLAKIDWGKILGAKGKGFSDVLKSDAEESKQVITSTLGGLHLDWSSILGEKDLKRLETLTAKVVSANADKLKGLIKEGDISGIQNVIDLVSTLGNELKALGASLDVAGLARSMGSFMKILSSVPEKFNKLASEPQKVANAFNLAFNDGKWANKTTQGVERIAKALVTLGSDKSAISNIKGIYAELDKVSRKSKIKIDVDYSKLTESQLTEKWNEQIDALEDMDDITLDDLIDNLDSYKDRAEKLLPILNNILKIEDAAKKKKFGSFISTAIEDEVAGFGGYTNKQVEDAINEIISSLNDEISKSKEKLQAAFESLFSGLSAIDLKLSLSDKDKNDFRDSINAYIDELNNSGTLKLVNIGIAPKKSQKPQEEIDEKQEKNNGESKRSDNVKNVEKQIQQRIDALNKELITKQNELKEKEREIDDWNSDPTNFGKTNTRLIGLQNRINENIKALEEARTSYETLLSMMNDSESADIIASDWNKNQIGISAMTAKQNEILAKTEIWRSKIIKAMSISSKDLTFDFSGVNPAKDLYNEIEEYFNESPINITIDTEGLSEQIRAIVEKEGINLGSGGVANIDPKAIASAVYAAITAAFTGEKMPSFDYSVNSDENELEDISIDDNIDEATESSKKYVKQLDETTIHIDEVIKSLKEFAKIATATKKDKDGNMVPAASTGVLKAKDWLTTYKGIDIEKIASGEVNDTDIRQMLQDALLTETEDGYASGSAFVDILKEFIVKHKIKTNKGSGAKLEALRTNIDELFKMLEINQESADAQSKRYKGVDVAQNAISAGQSLNLLNKVRGKLNPKNNLKRIPTIGDIQKVIDDFVSKGINTDDLEILKTAREALGDATDNESIETFRKAAYEFYEKSRSIFDTLNTQFGDFQGRVNIKGSKKNYDISKLKDVYTIPKNAVIVNAEVYKYIESKAVDKSIIGSTAMRESSWRKARRQEQSWLRKDNYTFTKADYLSNKPDDFGVRADILSDKVNVSKFVTKEEISGIITPLDLDASIEKANNEINNADAKLKENEAKLQELDAKIKNQDIKVKQAQKSLDDTSETRVSIDQSKVQSLIDKQSIKKSVVSNTNIGDLMKVANDYLLLKNKEKRIEGELSSLKSKNGNKSEIETKEKELSKVKKDLSVKDIGSLYPDFVSRVQKINSIAKEREKLQEQLRVVESLTADEAKKRLKSFEEDEMKLADLKAISPDKLTGNQRQEISSLQELVDRRANYKTLYQEFIKNPDATKINLQTSNASLTQQENSEKSAILEWARSEVEKLPQATAEIEKAAKPIISEYKQYLNSLYTEAVEVETKLGDKNLSDTDKNALLGHLQNILNFIKETQDEYSNFAKKVNGPEQILNKKQLSKISSLTDTYVTNTPSVASEAIEAKRKAESELQSTNHQKKNIELENRQLEDIKQSKTLSVLRYEKQKEYNSLKEKEVDLQNEIIKLEDNDPGSDKLKSKKKELDAISAKLIKIKNELKELGGQVANPATKPISNEDKKGYALDAAKQYQDQIIKLTAQKYVAESQIKKIDERKASIKKYGFGSKDGIDAKRRLISEFEKSDYYTEHQKALREKAKSEIAASEQKSKEIFDKKVAEEMKKRGWDPTDNIQTKKFLNSKEGQELSKSLESEIETNTKAIWAQYDIYKKDLHKRLIEDFTKSFKIDKQGMISATFKKQSDDGEWIDDVRGNEYLKNILTMLGEKKKDLKKQYKVDKIDSDIAYAEEQKLAAMAYGGLDQSDILNKDLVEQQIRYQKNIINNQGIIQQAKEKINVLEEAGLDNKSQEIKEQRKIIEQANEEIARNQILIDNRDRLIELRKREKEGSKLSDEEQRILATERLQKAKDNLAKTEEKITKLQKEYKDAKGTDNEMLALRRLDEAKKSKTSITERIAREEKRVGYWSRRVENKSKEDLDSTDGETTSEGGILGVIKAAVREAISGVSTNVEIDTSHLATEETLQAIYALLGGGNTSDAERAALEEELAEINKKLEGEGLSRNTKKSNSITTVDGKTISKVDFDNIIAKLAGGNQINDIAVKGVWNELSKRSMGNMSLEDIVKGIIDTQFPQAIGQWGKKFAPLKAESLSDVLNLVKEWVANDDKLIDDAIGKEAEDLKARNAAIEQFFNQQGLAKDGKKFYSSRQLSKAQTIGGTLTPEDVAKNIANRIGIAISEEIKENVANKVVENQVQQSTEDADEELDPKLLAQLQNNLTGLLNRIDTIENRIAELENIDTPEAQNEKNDLQTELVNLKSNVENTSNILKQLKGENLNNDKSDLLARKAEIEGKLSGSSGDGIIGIMRTLATENTLQKVLSALGEIAKKNAMSGKPNSAQDLLEQFRRMLESDAWEGRERVAYMDLATGSMSNAITGDDKAISTERLRILREAYAGKMDMNAQVHTHANADDPYFSPEDLKQFGIEFANGITKQILLSKNNMTVLDMTDVKDVDGLLEALSKTEQNFEALATTADKFGAKYTNKAFDSLTPQGLVKMLGIKGIESKLNQEETRDSAFKGVAEEEAKEAAKMLQDSTGRAVKTTVQRVGVELETLVEKTDTKGNKTWTSEINNKYQKAMEATNKRITEQNLGDAFGKGTNAAKALTEYETHYNKLLDLVTRFKSASKEEREGLQAEINALLPTFNEAEKKLVSLIERKDRFIGDDKIVATFGANKLKNTRKSLEAEARKRYGGKLNPGSNVAFGGYRRGQGSGQLYVDVLKEGTIKQYVLEVDQATGQVKEYVAAENALANAFQNVNKAMKQNEYVLADVAIGNTPEEQATWMANASAPQLNAYKKAFTEMQDYTAQLWNSKGSPTQEQLDYLMQLSERVMVLGKELQKTSGDFKNFWAQNPDNVFGIDFNAGDTVRSAMERYAQINANANSSKYEFASFDNNTLKYKLTDVEGNVRNVSMVWDELYQKVAIVSDKSVSALDPLVKKIEDYKQVIADAKNNSYLLDTDDAKFNEALKEVSILEQKVKDGTASFEELEAARRKAIGFGDATKKLAKKNEKLYTGTNEIRSAQRQYDEISGTSDVLKDGGNSSIAKKYISEYNALLDIYKKYASEHKLNDPQIQEQLRQQAAGVKKLGRELNSSAREAQTLQDEVKKSELLSYTDKKGKVHDGLGGSKTITPEEANNMQATMQAYAREVLNADLEHVKFNSTTQTLEGTLRKNNYVVSDMVVKYNDATESLYLYQKQERESLSGMPAFLRGLKEKSKAIMQYLASMTSIYRVVSMLRQGVQYIKEIDSALTELKKVTDETDETYNEFLKTAAKTADKVGSTIKDVVSSTADWARLNI